ncbi:(deoxy)nucleoside triphosphate pyrophosphohydrolase [Diaminobutyricibacter sp. McL0618]|uniref:(deoxy)nucleoside triphosphate pyrophosphohydrolase n=1 Tax=Leifsonia sp. McL0618 TaxID=3415677 RepID=UPI003CF49959
MRPVEVVAAVITSGMKVLACRRSMQKTASGLWEFPGGKVEAGESPESALVREVREELQVAIEVGQLIDRTVTVSAGVSIDLTCYHATLIGDPPKRSTDHDELRWMAVSDLPQLKWAEPDLPTVARLIAHANGSISGEPAADSYSPSIG